MALFKILKGNKSNLPSTYHEGYCYFTEDEHKFYIDTKINSEDTRLTLNAENADKLYAKIVDDSNQETYIEAIATNTLSDTNEEIPTSSAVFKEILELKSSFLCFNVNYTLGLASGVELPEWLSDISQYNIEFSYVPNSNDSVSDNFNKEKEYIKANLSASGVNNTLVISSNNQDVTQYSIILQCKLYL